MILDEIMAHDTTIASDRPPWLNHELMICADPRGDRMR